jgi:hypothetical protein
MPLDCLGTFAPECLPQRLRFLELSSALDGEPVVAFHTSYKAISQTHILHVLVYEASPPIEVFWEPNSLVTRDHVDILASEVFLEAHRVLALKAMLLLARASIVGRRCLRAILFMEYSSAVRNVLPANYRVRHDNFDHIATTRLGRSASRAHA